MATVFISYRRKPSAILAQLIVRDLKQRNIEAYLDTDRSDTAGAFPDRLLQAIKAADVFVCLVAEGTFESEWVQREIEHASRLDKPMIPIFQESLAARETRTGWTVGGGVEWAFFNNWSAKLEYDFYDLRARNVNLTGFFAGVGPSTFPAGSISVPGVRVRQTISQVKFGINYRFGGNKYCAY